MKISKYEWQIHQNHNWFQKANLTWRSISFSKLFIIELQELQRRLDQTLGKPGNYHHGIDKEGHIKPMTIGARLYRLENQVIKLSFSIQCPNFKETFSKNLLKSSTIVIFRWVKLTKSWMEWLKFCRQSSRCKNFNWLLLLQTLQLNIQIKQLQQHWWLLITTLLQVPLLQLLIHPLKNYYYRSLSSFHPCIPSFENSEIQNKLFKKPNNIENLFHYIAVWCNQSR